MQQEMIGPKPQIEIRQNVPLKAVVEVHLETTGEANPQLSIEQGGGSSWTSISPSFVITPTSEER